MKMLLLLLCLFMFTAGYSQDWELMSEQDNGTYYYKLHNDEMAWVKIVSEKTEYYSSKNSPKTSYIDGYQLMLWKFDCKSKKMGIVQRAVYSKDGKVLDTFKINDYLVEMDYVIPDSIGEGMIGFFCSGE